MSIPVEVEKKIKLLELKTRRLVNQVLSGDYKSAFKGQGMTFSEFREYVPGDDVRNISWNLTAKTGKPYVKIFEEEREQTFILAIDVSGSLDCGSHQFFKGEVLVHLAALLSFAAIKNNDKVGLLLFSDQVEHFVPPKKSKSQVQRILRDLYEFHPQKRQTSLSVPCEYLLGILKKRAMVFLLSDFMDKDFHRPLRSLARKHDLVAVVVEDFLEKDFPNLGLIEIEDSETGGILTVDSSSTSFRNQFKEIAQVGRQRRLEQVRKSGVDAVEVLNDENFVDPLIHYFKMRRLRG